MEIFFLHDYNFLFFNFLAEEIDSGSPDVMQMNTSGGTPIFCHFSLFHNFKTLWEIFWHFVPNFNTQMFFCR